MRTRVYLVVLALVAAGLVGWRACGGGQESEGGVTPELAGTWRTTSPGYADRYLEIGSQEIVFGQGEEGEARYPVLGVVRTSGPDDRAQFNLRYRLDAITEAEGKLEVLVGTSGLRIASQPGVLWTVER